MPVRKRIDRRRQELPDDAWDWLYGDDHTEWHYFQTKEALAAVWKKHGAEVVAEHIREQPGTRPARWWKYDAPRMAAPGKFWDGELAEHRRQIGGKGGQHPGAVPQSGFGVPWLFEGLDPLDPPVFESQAAYLDRHGLLPAVERRRLKPVDFEPEMLDAS